MSTEKMKKLKVAILEDEANEQEKTIDALTRFFGERDIEFSYFVERDPHAFLERDISDYDLALLDIIMPFDINGFDVSKVIRQTNSKIAIIFLTKTLNYAIQGYEVKALNYLLKPLIYEDFALKMTIFLKSIPSTSAKVHSFKCQGSLVKIAEKDIVYIDIYKHYLNIHTATNVFVTRGNIKDIMDVLSDSFGRCSNYCIVNFLYLEEIAKDDALIKGGERFKITAKYKKDFVKGFSHYLLTHE